MKIKVIYLNWVINPHNIGDTICTTSVVNNLLRKYPKADLTYYSNEFALDMFANDNRVKVSLPTDKMKGITEQEWGKALDVGYASDGKDIVVILSPGWQNDLFEHLNKNIDKILKNPEVNIITYNFHRMAGIEDYINQRPKVILSENDRKEAPQCKGLIAVNMSHKRETQKKERSIFRYDLKLNIKLIDLLINAGYKVIEVGYDRYMGVGNAYMGHRSIRQVCAIMEQCALFIGNDGGMHNVANAVNIPVLLFQSYPFNPPELFMMGNGTVLDNGCSKNKTCDHWAKIKGVQDSKESCDLICEKLKPELIAEKAIEILRGE